MAQGLISLYMFRWPNPFPITLNPKCLQAVGLLERMLETCKKFNGLRVQFLEFNEFNISVIFKFDFALPVGRYQHWYDSKCWCADPDEREREREREDKERERERERDGDRERERERDGETNRQTD